MLGYTIEADGAISIHMLLLVTLVCAILSNEKLCSQNTYSRGILQVLDRGRHCHCPTQLFRK